MVEIECPWCESPQRMDPGDIGDEFECAECLTRVLFEAALEEVALPLAA